MENFKRVVRKSDGKVYIDQHYGEDGEKIGYPANAMPIERFILVSPQPNNLEGLEILEF